MSMDVSHRRIAYRDEVLLEKEFDSNPFIQFGKWFKCVIDNCKNISEPNAMCLSTCSPDGKPSSRYVLMKSFSEESGFIFFSNYQSRKGIELAENPHACILFYWPCIHRQVRIEGTVAKISNEASREYFRTRPKRSQASAFISKQSQVVASRHELESKRDQCLDQYASDEIPKPTDWGGYSLQPSYFEFWQGHSSRLHDRIVFERDMSKGETWKISRLYP